MADEGHKPTSGMKSAAQRALDWHKEGKRGGTSVGLARANQIVANESLSDSTVKRMYSFFSRHEVDKKATGFNSGEEGYPSPGRVAWDLWGGDAGFAFARSKVKHTIKKMIMEELEKAVKSFNKKIKVGKMVSWNSSGGKAKGKVVRIVRDGSIKVPDSSFTITGTKDNPAVLIRVYKDGKPTETLVGHKMDTLSSVKKTIGNYSSISETPHNDSHVEYYIREEGENKTMTDKTTTEPDPTGDIAVTKSVDSDLARRKITKAISRLEKALKNLPDTSRASSVSVSNETAPVTKVDGEVEKAVTNLDGNPTKAAQQVNKAMKSLTKAITGLPDVSRAASVSVSNETAPVAKADGDAKQQGTDVKLNGEGDNSEKANTTVDTDAEPMTKATSCGPDCVGDNCTKCAAMGITKAACCDDCGDDCTGGACCNKCMKMAKEYTSPPSPASEGTVMAADGDNITKAAGDDDNDSEPDDDEDDTKVEKSDAPVATETKIEKSVWGGAFGTPNIPNMR